MLATGDKYIGVISQILIQKYRVGSGRQGRGLGGQIGVVIKGMRMYQPRVLCFDRFQVVESGNNCDVRYPFR